MIDNVVIASATALVSIAGTRWVDSRRQLAGERTTLAAELRVQLAEAHRRGVACVQAMERAIDAAAWDEHDEPTDSFRDATDEFERALSGLRSQASELLMRSYPRTRNDISKPVKSMLRSGDELLRWMRHGEIPGNWGDDEENFLLATTGNLTSQPELLILVGAPQAAPAAADPGTVAVIRRVAREERRRVYRTNLDSFVGKFTGKNRRELRSKRERQAALIASRVSDPPPMKHAETTFDNACILAVRVETNVPQGGDAGHGGKTRLTLRDEGSFAFGRLSRGFAPDDIAEIEVLGDIEAHVLAEALVWAGNQLDTLMKAGAGSQSSSGDA